MKRQEALSILASQVKFWSIEELKEFSYKELYGMLDSSNSTAELISQVESAKNIVKALELFNVLNIPENEEKSKEKL